MTTRDRGTRLPPNYRLVYDVVRAQAPGVHAPVGDIFAEAKARRPGLGYSTVYRALERLLALGLILQVHIPGTNAAVYEPARSGHAHFVCRLCGALEDIECELPSGAVSAAVAAHRGEVDEIVLTVHGRCHRCQEAGAPAALAPDPDTYTG